LNIFNSLKRCLTSWWAVNLNKFL